MYKQQVKRRWPEFIYPAPNGAERYETLAKLTLVAQKMKEFGVNVDLGKALKFHQDAKTRAQTFTQLFLEQSKLNASDLGKAGIGATKRVKEWFKNQGAPDVVFDKKSGNAQFNAAALVSWSSDFPGQSFAEPAAALLGIRKALVNSRFALNYYRVAERHNGRIHFSFNVLGTKGLRWSASEKFSWYEEGELQKVSLNAQNVPGKELKYTFKELGEQLLSESLRPIFCVGKGQTWIKFDYVGAEAYLIAYVTGDKLLLEWLKTGKDIHTENAKLLFLEAKVPADLAKIEDDSPFAPIRMVCKNGQYAFSYQMPSVNGKDKYPESFKFFKERFPKLQEEYFYVLIKRFFEGHAEIKGWQKKVCDQVATKGYVQLPQNGSVLYVPNSAKGKNMSGNFFMQNGVGYLINRATPHVEKLCDWKAEGTALLLQVHDELDMQAPDERVEELEAATKELLQQPANFGGIVAGLEVECKKGSSWDGE